MDQDVPFEFPDQAIDSQSSSNDGSSISNHMEATDASYEFSLSDLEQLTDPWKKISQEEDEKLKSARCSEETGRFCHTC